jgi:hypothetical protein
MKRCKVCHKITDNGTKRCQKCGTAFEYDPRVTPFSETKIILAFLAITVVVLIIYNAIPPKLPDPTECSQTSVDRLRRIFKTNLRETKLILKSEMLTGFDLSELMSYKLAAEDLPVPSCLEPAKAEMVGFFEDVYFTAMFSVRGGYRAASDRVQRSAVHMESFYAHLEEIETCLPNCQ